MAKPYRRNHPEREFPHIDIDEIRNLVGVMRDTGILELEMHDIRGKIRLVCEGRIREGQRVEEAA